MSFIPREKKGIRLLYHANAPWAKTGYGIQSNSLLPRLAKHPNIDEIALLAYYGIAGGVSEQEIGFEVPVEHIKVKCFPARSDPWGNDVIQDHVTLFDADAVITLFDLWPLAPDFGWRGARWMPWFPVDHEPIPAQVLERTRVTYENLVYSKSAAEELGKNGVHYTYIPHGVETSLYKPLSAAAKAKAKQNLGYPPDCFLVGTVGANKGYPPRKGWNEMYTAMAEFLKVAPNPENVYFYQHSLCTGEHGGPDLTQMASAFGLGDKLRFANPYVLQSMGNTTAEMNDMYNAMDAFILLSRGEGFGIPILEAQSCGVPVVVTDWTAMRELGEVGYKVELSHREWTPQNSFWGIANPFKAAEALLDIYHKWLAEKSNLGHKYTDLSVAAREFAMPYDWQTIVDEQWFPLFDRIWSEIKPRVWGPLPKVWEDPEFGFIEVPVEIVQPDSNVVAFPEESNAVRTDNGNSVEDRGELVPTSY